jgi:hypothetical protein
MKLHLICGKDPKRAWMSYIQFKDGFFTATNGKVLVRVPAKMAFPDVEFPQNRTFYVSATEWKTSKIWEAKSVNMDGNMIVTVTKKDMVYNIITDTDINYANVERLIDNETTPLEVISLDAELLATVQDACNLPFVNLHFRGRERGIRITTNEDQNFLGMIMPTLNPVI